MNSWILITSSATIVIISTSCFIFSSSGSSTRGTIGDNSGQNLFNLSTKQMWSKKTFCFVCVRFFSESKIGISIPTRRTLPCDNRFTYFFLQIFSSLQARTPLAFRSLVALLVCHCIAVLTFLMASVFSFSC